MNDDSFWKFSQAIYSASNVREECLELQDTFGIDVNMLLFCAYVGACAKTILSEREIIDAKSVVEEWHREIVIQIRRARRSLKTIMAPADNALSSEMEQLRNKLKAIELQAEYLEQAMLTNWLAKRDSKNQPRDAAGQIEKNITLLFAVCGKITGREAPPLPRYLMKASASFVS